jgi:serine/threonine-protein kinase
LEHFGKYQLIRKLATGGMAEVYLAKSAGPMGFEKILVLKRILPHLSEDPAFIQKFLAEAKLAARLNHPNVVQIFELGEYDGGYFIAMEYIEGASLRTVCRRLERVGANLPPAFCAKLVSMACEGLAYAHDFRDPETDQWLGIVHRDISPENVLVSRTGTVKVVDFGLAKAMALDVTKSRVLFGKYWYMSPEQIRRKEKLDRRVDVYALGVVLYELLTAQKPFDAVGEVEMMRAILSEQFIPASKRRPDVPAALERILAKALARREQRYPDCLAFQAELESFILSTGSPMGTQQISRILGELGVLPGSTGQHATPVRPPPPPEPTRAAPSLEERLNRPTRTSPGMEAEEEPVTDFGGKLPPPATRLFDPHDAKTGETPDLEEEDDPMARTLLDVRKTPPGATTGETLLFDRVADPASDSRGPQERTLRDQKLPGFDPPAPGVSNWFNEPTGSTSVTGSTTVPISTLPPLRPEPRSSWLNIVLAVGALVLLGAGTAVVVHRIASRPAPSEPSTAPTTTPATTATTPATTPAPEPTAAPAPAEEKQPLARVTLMSEPHGDISVNGVAIGHSPVVLVDVPAGEVLVEVSDSRLGFRKQERLRLKPGDNGTRTIVTQLLPVQLRVTPRAHVSVDGRELGEVATVTIQLFEGTHRIHLINRELYTDKVEELTVVAGEANAFTYDLRP